MRISDASTAYSLIGQLQNLKSRQSSLEEQLVTGKKVTSVADDPALGGTLLNSQATRERLVQFHTNATMADNMAQSGVDTLTYMKKEIDLSLKVAESAQNSTGDSAALASQIDNIVSGLLSAANTSYNGDYLFAGSKSSSDTAPFSYDETTRQYVYNGSGEGRQIEVASGVTVSPFTSDDQNQQILNALNSLLSLKNAITSGDADAVATAADSLQSAQDGITEASSDLGTTQSRLDLIEARNANLYTNLDNAEESATNSDENEVTVKLLAAQNAYSASLQGTAMLLRTSLLDYM
jgi:flagellar hook-associated protein 3 FlgL